jgi:hypothetical protein
MSRMIGPVPAGTEVATVETDWSTEVVLTLSGTQNGEPFAEVSSYKFKRRDAEMSDALHRDLRELTEFRTQLEIAGLEPRPATIRRFGDFNQERRGLRNFVQRCLTMELLSELPPLDGIPDNLRREIEAEWAKGHPPLP